MEYVYRKIHINGSIIALITFCYLFPFEFTDGTKIVAGTVKHKGTIKSIESENGEVIDCIDIYKQPAFDHPILKNHTIETLGGSSQDGEERVNFQAWNQNGEYCPEGSIPFLRAPKLNYPKKVSLRSPIYPNRTIDSTGIVHEYAQIDLLTKNYGASARLNVWTPLTLFSEFSNAQLWVTAGQQDDMNSIEAGWMAYNGETETRFFIFWTKDNYKTGCYNLDCPGFIQVSTRIALGGIIKPISTYDGPQFELRITIYKGLQSGDWWLQLADEKVGYWPKSIFTSLVEFSDYLTWGSEIINAGFGGHHTTTQMGSGHYPNEGLKKASYFGFIKYKDVDGTFKDAQGVRPHATKPTCYDITVGQHPIAGTYFFYGGPGFSNICP